MNENELAVWGNSIIHKVKTHIQELCIEQFEFAIFYSPIKLQPKLMIIGDNPGGKIEQLGLYKIPEIHEYIDTNQRYRLLLQCVIKS